MFRVEETSDLKLVDEALHCNRTGLKSAEAVTSHYRDKHRECKEPCLTCGYFFMNKAEYEQHYNNEHSTKKVHNLPKKNKKNN